MPPSASSWCCGRPPITTDAPPEQATESDLSDLYDRAPFGYVSTTPDWHIVRANATFAGLVGRIADELIGQSLTSLMGVGSQIYHETHYAPLVALQGEVREVAADLVRPDGGIVPVLIGSVVVRGEDDAPDVVRTSVVPATDRRQFEVEIQSARREAEAARRRIALVARLVAALASATDTNEVAHAVSSILGPGANTGIWNVDGGEALAALSPDAAPPPPVALDDDGAIARAWRDGDVTVDAVHDLVAIPIEITEHGPRAVAALGRRRLDELVEEPGHSTPNPPSTDLDDEQRSLLTTIGQEIGQALERARITEHKDWLLGVAAHDLRSPLTVVIGNAQTLGLLLEDRLEDRERDLLERIEATGTRMSTLIGDVLDISSIESGTLTIDRVPTNLATLTSDAVADNRHLAEPKQIELHLELPPEVPELTIDRDRIRQVVDNLLSNAIKYSDPGSPVFITLEASGDEVVLSVRDEGQGIAEDELAQVFVPFRRTRSQPTAGETSTGLGLSIAKSIVEAHGGRIWVDSDVSLGTTFRFSLPSQPH